MADDGYVTVFRTTDLAECELVAELLAGEGIIARFSRASGAQIGGGQQIFETRVDVPVESEARVRELLADLAYVGAATDLESDPEGAPAGDPAAEAEGEPESEDSDAVAEPPPAVAQRRLLLSGVAFLIPGGGHFYARRPWTGFVIAGAIVCCYAAALGTATRGGDFKGELAFGAFIALYLCDAIGGLRACQAENRGIHRGQSDQILRGLVLMVVAIGAGAVFAGAAATPRLLTVRRLQRFVVRATPTELTVENDDPDGRRVQISGLRLRVGGSTMGRLYDVDGDRLLLGLKSGDAATMRFDLPDDVADYCRALDSDVSAGSTVRAAAGPIPGYGCTLVFELYAVRPDGSGLLEGAGSCPVRWDAGAEGLACQIGARAQYSFVGGGR